MTVSVQADFDPCPMSFALQLNGMQTLMSRITLVYIMNHDNISGPANIQAVYSRWDGPCLS
jgi:hypothetical protein